jgi:alkylation response protein AidB-like acyl-CoA dehydrogenase
MDLSLTKEELVFRDELRAWLKDNVPAPYEASRSEGGQGVQAYYDFLRDWQRALFRGGWAGTAWPTEYGGRGANPIQQSTLSAELTRARAPERVGVLGEALVGPTIMAVGTEAQKKHFLPRILAGDDIWCQGFSEPNAGSDVAALATKAVRDGDHYVVNGQKIWTSVAHLADWCLLLTRTDPTARKHKGITVFLVDMKSPGVSVRPLKQITGDAGFNEVFFSDVRIPIENQLGEENDGWRVTITILMNERANLGLTIYVGMKRSLDALVEKARSIKRGGRTLAEDPINRQKIAQMYLELEVFRLNSERALSRQNKNEVPGPEGSIGKLYWSELNQRLSRTAGEILGDVAQLDGYDGGRWKFDYLRSRGNTIEAGTSEIQRNIIAQRVLGLPRSY